jgi:uncharacterized protein (TIGR00369 family)
VQEHYDKLRRMYLAAPCNQTYAALEMTISEGRARVEFRTGQKEQHAAGGMHGSYYFKLLDDAAFFAASSLVPDVFVLTANFTVSLLRPIAQGRVYAEGRVVKPGENLYFAESVLYGPTGKELGRGSGSFARSKVSLASVKTYA